MGDVIYMDVAAYGVRETMLEALDAFKALDTTSPTYHEDFLSGMERCMAARRRYERFEPEMRRLLQESWPC